MKGGFFERSGGNGGGSRNTADRIVFALVRFLLVLAGFSLVALWYTAARSARRWFFLGALTIFLGAVVTLFYITGEFPYEFLLAGLSVNWLLTSTIWYFVRGRRLGFEENVREVFAATWPYKLAPKDQRIEVKYKDHLPAEVEIEIPRDVVRSQAPAIENRVRQRLGVPAGVWGGIAPDSSWRFIWRWQHHRVHLIPCPDLPSFVPWPGPGPTWHDIPIGRSFTGTLYWKALKVPHLLIAGTTGGGKSVAISTVLAHVGCWGDYWDVYAIDPKRTEFGYLVGQPWVVDVAFDLGHIADVVIRVRVEMENRLDDMRQAGVHSFLDLQDTPRAILLTADEMFELAVLSGLKDEKSKADDARRQAIMADIQRVARLGRAAGVFLLLATQRPDASVFPGALKNNVVGRLAVGRLTPEGSRMVIEDDSAAELDGTPGRGVWRSGSDVREVQVFYAGETDVLAAYELEDTP